MKLFSINDCSGNIRNGFTLIEALVGVSLLAIVFSGIFAAYRLGVKVVGLSKNRIVAASIANSQIEKIRNLSYESVGTEGAELPFAAGILESSFSQTVGDAAFAVLTQVRYISDEADGVGGGDSCNLDYKKADITVSWGGNYAGSVALSTNISPKNQVQESQSCLDQPGGVLSVVVFDDGGNPVLMPNVSIYNPLTGGLVALATPAGGEYSFPLAAGTYRVEVSKTDYSSARTYGTDEIPVPDNPNPTVLEDNETRVSISIDRAAAVFVDGISPTGQSDFADSFDDGSSISEASDAAVFSGDIVLAGDPYASTGAAVSVAVAPSDMVVWDELRFDDSRPAATNISYQILYYDGVDWILVPELDLEGNAAGFANSPVDLRGLAKSAYPQIKIRANLSSDDPALTPAVHSWQVFWTTNSGVPVSGAAFHMQGAKTVGENDSGEKIYKYSQDLILDNFGHLDVAGIDGDGYTFSVDPDDGLNLIGTDPAALPVNVASGGSAAVKLFLRAQNALLATVQDDITLLPVFSAAVILTDSASGYSKTQYTDQNGQTYFAPLDNVSYDISVSAAGYGAYSGTVLVSGGSVEIINIHQNE